MRKARTLKKKFNAFVNQLSPDECREQLVLAYMQMERCQDVLRGEDVEPVEMEDNGLSSDLELFYLCKKVREELDEPDSLVSMLAFVFKDRLDDDSDEEDYRYLKPDKKVIDAIKEWSRKQSSKRFRIGDEVWYMFGDRIHHGTIDYPLSDTDGENAYMTKEGHTTVECETFRSLEELIEYLKKTANEHYGR